MSRGFKEGDLVEWLGEDESDRAGPRTGERGKIVTAGSVTFDEWVVNFEGGAVGVFPVSELRLVKSSEAT